MLTVRYYATQVPEVFVILLPVSLLLALLFVLGRMSRSNEIVSMLTAGVSIPRVLAPLIGMGLLTVAGSFALNYALAPHAEMAKKNFIATARSHQVTVQGQIFRNRTRSRSNIGAKRPFDSAAPMSAPNISVFPNCESTFISIPISQ